MEQNKYNVNHERKKKKVRKLIKQRFSSFHTINQVLFYFFIDLNKFEFFEYLLIRKSLSHKFSLEEEKLIKGVF